MNKIISDIINKYNFDDFNLISPKNIIISQRVRVKCAYGCDSYGYGACPPNAPSIAESREFFSEYSLAALIILSIKNNFSDDEHSRISNINDINNRKLLELEREASKSGYPFAFAFYHSNCINICQSDHNCNNKINCENKSNCRPCPTAFGVDMHSTLKQNNIDIIPIDLNSGYYHKYSILLIE